MTNRISDPVVFDEFHVTRSLTLPNETLRDSHWSTTTADKLTAEKCNHQKVISKYEATASGSPSGLLHRAMGSGTIENARFCVATAATTNTATFDIQKASNGATAYTSILDKTVTLAAADTRESVQEYLSVATANVTYSAGDRFKYVITDAGGGSAATEIIVTLVVSEAPS